MTGREAFEQLLAEVGEDEEGVHEVFDYGDNPMDWPVNWRAMRQLAEHLAKLADGEETTESLRGRQADWAGFLFHIMENAADKQARQLLADMVEDLDRLSRGKPAHTTLAATAGIIYSIIRFPRKSGLLARLRGH